ncbi:acyltransferase family protein [Empedobacter tilapiae]
MQNKRIDIIDGFRVLAILIVMLYHFYSSFLNHYQYNFDSSIFHFGHLGVQFFFIISGFVIFMTLKNTKNLLEFIKKRYMRLMPGMLVCSIITFSIYNIFDTTFYPPAKDFKNLLFSNTFISPSVPNKLFNTHLDYIDSSYWSLWVEIIFYSLISILYFLNKRYAILNYSIIAIGSTILWYFFGTEDNVLNISIHNKIHKIINYIPFINLLIWFLVGIVISKLFINIKNYSYNFYLIFLFVLIFITSKDIEVKYFTGISALIWFIFLYKNHWLNFLGGNLIAKLGRSSYSIYLIHQMIGVLIIIRVSPYFGENNWIIPIALIVLSLVFGLFSFKYLEKPIGKMLQNILFKK